MRRKEKFGGVTVAGVPQKEEKNWVAQIAMAILVGVVFCGPLIARGAGWHMSRDAVGLAVAVDLLLIVAIAWWALRTWDY